MATTPYGSWTSPVGVDQLTSASIGVNAPKIDGSDLYWLESHADQGGRTSIWRRPLAGGDSVELTPGPSNVRDRVHEYGGGEYDVRDGVVVYSEFTDGRVRVIRNGGTTTITPEADLRFADFRVHPDRDLVLAVREDHRGPGEAVNSIVALELAGPNADGGTVVCAGADFYSTPELSTDGRLAWTQWDHPNMPWDATAIMVGTLDDGVVTQVQAIAGGPAESAVQPRWLGDGLVFVSDRTDWWNLYVWDGSGVRALHAADIEFCGPQWVLGQSPYAVVGPDQLLCTTLGGGLPTVALLTVSTGELTPIVDPGVGANALDTSGGRAAAVLTYPDRPAALAVVDLDTHVWTEVLSTSTVELGAPWVSIAEPVSWPSAEGDVHGWYYPPTHPETTAPEGTLPPLITLSHGGPTAFASSSFNLGYQFWTTRGYAILDVNYGGSTGYGRAYRDRLKDRWGIVDVADCAEGAAAMGEQGRADPARLVIKGGSAGGYTTLQALTSTTVFAAGISQYGIGDLEALATDTHKFESRYTDGLVGPYPAAREVYVERSPIHHVDRLAAPILLLQGLEDRVVPPNQAETFADAARAKGLPVALIMFAGEGHGFRRSETIVASIQAQLYFLGQILRFTPADTVPPIDIENLPG
ncbi:MAG TPA: prolyl oligopeptidase family serine peptidase [Propionibacteriaceae bacterium]